MDNKETAPKPAQGEEDAFSSVGREWSNETIVDVIEQNMAFIERLLRQLIITNEDGVVLDNDATTKPIIELQKFNLNLTKRLAGV